MTDNQIAELIGRLREPNKPGHLTVISADETGKLLDMMVDAATALEALQKKNADMRYRLQHSMPIAGGNPLVSNETICAPTRSEG